MVGNEKGVKDEWMGRRGRKEKRRREEERTEMTK